MNLDAYGVSIHYEAIGQGPPLLLLHGWGGSIGSMRPVADALADLRTCTIPDFPGFGESSSPPEPWSVTEYTRCLAAFMEKAGIAKADVVAHSFGARVALLLAAEHPELVGKIVITGGAGLKPKRNLKYYGKVYSYKLGKRMLRHSLDGGLRAPFRGGPAKKGGAGGQRGLPRSPRRDEEDVRARSESGPAKLPEKDEILYAAHLGRAGCRRRRCGWGRSWKRRYRTPGSWYSRGGGISRIWRSCPDS